MNIQFNVTTLVLLLLMLASYVRAQPGVFNIRKYGAPNGDITNVRAYYIICFKNLKQDSLCM